MARAGRPKYTPEELERLRNSVVRNGDTSYIPREVYRQIERDRLAGGDPGFTQPGGGPDKFGLDVRKFNPGGRDRGSDLARYQELIGRLERSRGRRGGTTRRRPADLVDRRGKTRKGRDSGNSRSYEDRKAEADRRQAEYSANQDRYRGDFESSGGMTQQVIVPWYNPETGARWSAPNPGYKPKEGTGWVKGYGPNTNEGKSPGHTQPGFDTHIRPGGGMYDYKKPWMTEEDNEAFLRKWGKSKSNPTEKATEKTPTKGSKFEAMLRGRMRRF